MRFAVAFLLKSGWKIIADRLWDLLVQRKGTAIILTGDYLDVSDPDALQNLLDLSQTPEVNGRLKARVFEATRAGRSFHPKAYLFVSAQGQSAAYVGSSNLSAPALTTGVECQALSDLPSRCLRLHRHGRVPSCLRGRLPQNPGPLHSAFPPGDHGHSRADGRRRPSEPVRRERLMYET